MVPQTFPSVYDTDGQQLMTIYVLSSVSGLTKWVDYIPVKRIDVGTKNSYNNDGYIGVSQVASTTGLAAFKDYIPVYLDESATDAWTVNATGFIPCGNYLRGLAVTALQANTGVLFEPSPSYCYTNEAGTTPAGDGDLVAHIKCAVGSGKTATFPSGARPVLRKAGPVWYFDPNGVNSYGVTDCTASGLANMAMIGHGSASGQGKVFAGCFDSPDTRMYFGIADGSAAGKIGAGVDGVSWTTLNVNAGWTTDKVVSIKRTATVATLYVDGVLVDTETVSGVGSSLVAHLMALNNDGTPIDFWNGPWLGMAGFLSDVPTAARQAVENYFAQRLAVINYS